MSSCDRACQCVVHCAVSEDVANITGNVHLIFMVRFVTPSCYVYKELCLTTSSAGLFLKTKWKFF